MPLTRTATEVRLVNGSTGDPALFVDYPGRDDALLFDAGELCRVPMGRLADLAAVFLTHHHIDHFVGFDRILRANLDRDKTLRVVGPAGTIDRVYRRVTSYEHGFYPFQKLTVEVVELVEGRKRVAALECAKRFPEPVPSESAWTGPLVFETKVLRVEAAPADHTVPCLAYAVVEPPGVHPDPEKLAAGPLRAGRWIGEVQARLIAGDPAETPIEVDGLRVPLGQLALRYFRQTRGSRIAYITDTCWSDAARPGLVRLAHRARRLYCDSYYAEAQRKQAERHRHMTATDAAALAVEAKVEELILMHFAPRYADDYTRLLDEARAIFPRTTAELGEPG